MAMDDDKGIAEFLQELFVRKDGIKEFLEAVLNTVMKAEVDEHVCAEPYERSSRRRGMRNGTKPRSLKTRVGQLDLEIPQVRGCEPYHPSMFARWQRSERAMLTACAQMYFQGVSTRRVQEVLKEMGGFGISAGQVSRIAAELDEQLSVFSVGQSHSRSVRPNNLRNLCLPAIAAPATAGNLRIIHPSAFILHPCLQWRLFARRAHRVSETRRGNGGEMGADRSPPPSLGLWRARRLPACCGTTSNHA